jgi:DNA replication and repair protein RecF
MVLKTLEAVNFRNLDPLKLTFSSQINIFYGDNAQGKTNLIEAIFLLSFLKSFRAETDQELITWDKGEARLKGEFDSQTLSIELKKTGKEIRLNNTVKRALEALGVLQVASFSPEDILLVTGAPALRRRFLDSLASLLSRQYLYNLANLQKIIKNRNRVLFWLRDGRSMDLNVWDEQLTEYASLIWLGRRDLVAKINVIIKPLSKQLLGSDNLQLEYQPKLELNKEATLPDVRAQIHAKLSSIKAEEIRRATTLIGPQRDDFTLLSEELQGEKIIYKDIGIYGSRGEQRVGILALKLAELDLIQKESGERPILLLDDVLSEFDHNHRAHLLRLLAKQQTFITTTDLTLFPPEVLSKAKKFKVVGGIPKED